MTMLEDFRLRIFDTVVRLGSFTRAATELGISQPAVSQSMAELEKLLGVTLFLRSRKGLSLTPRGEEFRSYCNKILYWYDAAQRAMSSDGSEPEEEKITRITLEDGRKVELAVSPEGLNLKIL